ncbi:MAG: hypothetical protein ABIS45_17170 [Burkholderiales bacterium]
MLNVLHGPVNVGNQPWVLSRHERACGVHSDLIVNFNTWLGYAFDRCLSAPGKSPLGAVKRLLFGLSAPFRYDVLHYYFGLSFLCWNDYGGRNPLWFADLKLAKQLGRKVFMTLQGCDARISSRSADHNAVTPCALGECDSATACRAQIDLQRQYLINEILPLVDRVFVLNPELARYVPDAVFMPYASVDIDAFEPAWPTTTGPAVIVHAPSDPSIKGSRYIIDAVERLKRRFAIEFIQVKGMPHAEAVKTYRGADLVIDQVLAGWYGGFAVEAMAMGKPVACYIRREDLAFVPPEMAAALPLLNIAPATLEEDLAGILRQRERWPEWGRRSRDYVVRWHHPRRIAQAMVAAYRHPQSVFDLADASAVAGGDSFNTQAH